MEVKLPLCMFTLFVQVSLAVWQRVTVMKGQTLNLSCPITNAQKTHVDWKNPNGFIMFFNGNQALKDERYSINKLSNSEFSISISNVTFKDGGNYTCTRYGRRTRERKVEVTVLGYPKMSVVKHEGKTIVKCTAEGNHFPPQISWKFNDQHEFLGQTPHVYQEGKKFISMGMLQVLSVVNRVTVKCLVRHPALHSQHLMNFVKIGQDVRRFHGTTTTSSPTVQPQGSTTSVYRHDKTTNRPVTSDQPPSSYDQTTVTAPTRFPADTSTGLHLNTSDDSGTSAVPGSTQMNNDTNSTATSTAGWTSVSATEDTTFYNGTERNKTETFDSNRHSGSQGNSSLLVFLVTCLIFCLLVVVIFFAIKLRRAHMAWKRENEDSDPSEDSSKSKSSQEEKNSQGQRRRGNISTAFTQYVIEEPAVITSVSNTAAVTAAESVNREQASHPRGPAQPSDKSNIKETSL
ncbi:cytotoxic and regulatory T-cell molecule-like [Parambassis ranga]|uniref:Cytotoxic and regulatory T-cell molecule-like n=1 Tax=Parambassis ranga TaxID=210632 RepID=A0A6P7HF07_9TELE|nr:cytotoxic and regulatory T-cell molecule-like [Parambassis ranga]